MGFYKNIVRRKEQGNHRKQKNSASKYDFVKVRVHLSEQHYYVLSRFLLCRMLMAARIDYGHAFRIALDLKKRLIDKGQLIISQKNLQSELFDMVRQHGYSPEHIQWYETMASFHHQRIPLVILLAGTGLTGKSSIATKLSERLNLSSVLKTDVVYELMHTIKDGVTPPLLWSTGKMNTPNEIEQECQFVCRGLAADIYKSVTDGKSIIIEGDLVNHQLLDQMDEFTNQKQTVIVAPFLLTLSEPSLHQQLIHEAHLVEQDKVEGVIESIEAWESYLLEENCSRHAHSLLSFHVIQVNMECLQKSIDTIQSIVLDQIAATMKGSVS
ncbi:hypothetical protein BDF14DRAFT_1312605 [Spinellus fusiger]|nr:hypothetical protein BDF14DRAFT_1312605 [Spinellus fusiger]